MCVDFYSSFHFFFICTKYTGFYPFTYDRKNQEISFSKMSVFVTVIFFAILNFGFVWTGNLDNLIDSVNYSSPVESLSIYLLNDCQYFLLNFIFIYICMKRRNFEFIVNQLIVIDQVFSELGYPFCNRKIKIFVNVSIVVVSIVSVSSVIYDGYVYESIQWGLYYVLVMYVPFLPSNFYYLQYIFFVVNIRHRLEHISKIFDLMEKNFSLLDDAEERLLFRDELLTKDTLRHLYKVYIKIYKLFDNFSEAYSLPFFFFILFNQYSITLTIYLVYYELYKNTLELGVSIVFGWYLVIYFIQTIWLVCTCNYAQEKGNKLAWSLHKFQNTVDIKELDTIVIHFSRTIILQPIKFTLGEIFAVENELLMEIINNVCLTLVILIQFDDLIGAFNT